MRALTQVRRACALAGFGSLVLGMASGCGSSTDKGDTGSGAGAPASSGQSNAGAAHGGGQNVGGSSVALPSGGTGGGEELDECADQVVSGKLTPLDMFIMLDTSGSMLDVTEAGEEKWASVRDALVAFLSDSGSDGLGVGIQYFPQRKPGVPDTCTSNAQCGDGAPCILTTCWDAPVLLPCEQTSDCRLGPLQDYGECVTFGFCANDPSYVCRDPGSNTQCGVSPDGVNLGACRAEASVCLNASRCDVDGYAEADVPISPLPEAAELLVSSIDSQEPEGLTPTGPAIQGAIDHARAWALENPDHTVVTLLATDGLPTECAPLEIPNVAGLAASGVQGSPSIRTFVVGVFGPNDPDARANLDSIARSGGTESAFLVDTSRDVTMQFLDALSRIRGSLLSCDLPIPEPTGGDPLDYYRVNVELTIGSTTTPLFKGASEAACDADGGWFYDSDPAVTAPTRIILCPTTCQSAQASTDASIQIQLGCMSRVR